MFMHNGEYIVVYTIAQTSFNAQWIPSDDEMRARAFLCIRMYVYKVERIMNSIYRTLRVVTTLLIQFKHQLFVSIVRRCFMNGLLISLTSITSLFVKYFHLKTIHLNDAAEQKQWLNGVRPLRDFFLLSKELLCSSQVCNTHILQWTNCRSDTLFNIAFHAISVCSGSGLLVLISIKGDG